MDGITLKNLIRSLGAVVQVFSAVFTYDDIKTALAVVVDHEQKKKEAACSHKRN
jgi:hypothetical protein